MSNLFIFGDSVMKGILYNEADQKYTFREGADFASLKACGFNEVFNMAKMGATIPYVNKILQRTLPRIQAGDTVIIGCGGNDSDHAWAEVAANPSGDHFPKTMPEVFLQTYADCLQLCRQAGTKVLMVNLAPIDAHRYMAKISGNESNYKAILSWLGDETMLYRWQESYNQAVERLAVHEQCPLIDIRSAFLVNHHYGALFCSDGIHPTEEGYQLLDKALFQALMSQSEPFLTQFEGKPSFSLFAS